MAASTPLKRRLGPSRSPVVPEVVARLQKKKRASLALRWGALYSVAMVFLLVDIYYGILSSYLGISNAVIWASELALLLLLFLTVLYNFALVVGVSLFWSPIMLTNPQRKMLRLEEEDVQTVSTPVDFGQPLHESLPGQMPSPIVTPYSATPSMHFRTPTGSMQNTPPYSSGYTPSRSQSSLGPRASPFRSERIASLDSLDHYLQTEEDREQWASQGSPEIYYVEQVPYLWQSAVATGSGDGGGGSGRRKYHMATRCLSFTEDEDGREGDKIWAKLSISTSDLSRWTERCRQWLAQSILAPVAEEIKCINRTLEKIGLSDIHIGRTSLDQLRDVAHLRTQQLPTLGVMIRYLDLTPKQNDLVKRIDELAKGGCIGAYRWSAGNPKGSAIPTDAEIVAHFFCTYMDSQLPPSPQFHDGRTFSHQFFLKTPSQPANKKADVCIYQFSSSPVHFKVLVRDGSIEIPRGKHNLFHSLVAFVHHIKTKEKGLLGQLDLKLSSMNLLWIIDSKL